MHGGARAARSGEGSIRGGGGLWDRSVHRGVGGSGTDRSIHGASAPGGGASANARFAAGGQQATTTAV